MENCRLKVFSVQSLQSIHMLLLNVSYLVPFRALCRCLWAFLEVSYKFSMQRQPKLNRLARCIGTTAETTEQHKRCGKCKAQSSLLLSGLDGGVSRVGGGSGAPRSGGRGPATVPGRSSTAAAPAAPPPLRSQRPDHLVQLSRCSSFLVVFEVLSEHSA